MNHELIQNAEKYNKRHYRKKIWKKVVGVLGCFVVFCTTYALILPAITMEREPICGQEEHTHTEECYAQVLTCDTNTLELHQHTQDCYDENDNLVCGYANYVVHTHDENCYDANGNLVCDLPEIEEHVHDDSCYQEQKVLVCGQEETVDHVHSDECYKVEQVLVCGQQELHTHTDVCYDGSGNLICGLLELTAHQHTADCFEEVLICDKEEHQHTEDCYPAAEPETGSNVAPENSSNPEPETGSSNVAPETSSDAEPETSSDAEPEDPDASDDNYGIMPLDDDPGSDVSPENPTSNPLGEGYEDFSGFVTDVTYKVAVNGVYTDISNVESVDADQKIKVNIEFEVEEGSNVNSTDKYYIKLPDTMEIPDGLGGNIRDSSLNMQSGTYAFEKDANGNWYLVITFTEDYLNEVGEETFTGYVEFNFSWDEDELKEGSNDIDLTIGEVENSITVNYEKKEEEDGGEESNQSGYSLSKSYSNITYDESGNAYLEHTITLSVWGNDGVAAPIELTDTVSGIDGVTLDTNSVQFTDGNGNSITNLTLGKAQNGGDTTFTVGSEGDMIPAGDYKITYKVKVPGATDTSFAGGSVTNAVVGDNGSNATTWWEIKQSKIGKYGNLTEDETGTVQWTVNINKGNITANLGNAYFGDTLPENSELSSDITIEQYSPDGTLVGTTAITKDKVTSQDGYDIYYDLPDGQYSYVITYETKLKDDAKVSEEPQIVNIGSFGDGNGTEDAYANVGINNGGSGGDGGDAALLTKTNEGASNAMDEDGNKVLILDWKSVIDRDVSDGDYYIDYVYQGDEYTWPQYMTTKQLQNIKVVSGTGSLLRAGTDYYLDEVGSNDVPETGYVGLYKIEFAQEINGPITIYYSTTVNLSVLANNDWNNIENKAQAIVSEETGWGQATKYYVYKDEIKKSTDQTGDKYELGINNKINWVIQVDKGTDLTGTITVTDTIPAGLTLDESSIYLTNGNDSWWPVNKDTDYIYAVVKNTDGTTTLTFEIYESAYRNSYEDGKQYELTIKYTTQVADEEYLSGSQMTATYTNTVSMETKNVTDYDSHTVTVERDVIGKSGSYDETTKQLNYSVTINPSGSDLVEYSDVLTVTDEMESNLNLELVNISLFTAVEDEEGNIVPGQIAHELTKVDTIKEETAYIYTYQHVYDETTHTYKIVTCVPDGHAYVLVYSYLTLDELSAARTLSNKVTLSGQGEIFDASEDQTEVKEQSSSAETKVEFTFIIKKHDASVYNNLLDDAHFVLYWWNGSDWTQDDEDKITEDGIITSGALTKDMLYKLVETEAPPGYVLDSTPYYFVITDKTADELGFPTEDNGQPINYTTYSATLYRNKSFIIDRYNAQDTNYVPEGAFRVNKVWKDGSGATITDEETLSAMPQIQVELHQVTTQSGLSVPGYTGETHTLTVTTYKKNEDGTATPTTETYRLPADYTVTANISADGGQTIYRLDSGSAVWINSGLINISMTQDHILEVNGMDQYNNKVWTFNSNVDVKVTVTDPDGNPVTLVENNDTTDIVYATATLKPGNNWTYLWEGLTSGDNTSYYVKEVAPEGYSVSYTTYVKENGELVEQNAGTEQSPDIDLSAGTILNITNQAEEEKESYELPETGGPGATLYTAGGLIVSASAAFLMYKNFRRRKEDI